MIAVFWAALVRRWHTNPHLAGSGDTNGAHQGRVARLLLKLHPHASRELLVAALTHDDGEADTADLPGPYKRALRAFEPAAMDALDRMEADARAEIWGYDTLADLSPDDAKWLGFADRLDAYQWADLHGARMDRDGWPEARQWLEAEAAALGVEI